MYVINILLSLFLIILSLENVNSQALIAIDFGGTYTKVSAIRIGKLMEIVLDFDSNRKTLNCIGFKDGYLVFGEAAKNLYRRLPGAVIFDIMSLLGAKYSSLAAEKYRKIYPYVEMSEDPSTGRIIIHPAKYNYTFTVVELLALMVHETLSYSRLYMSYDVNEVMISLPPNTHQAQLSDIKAALKLLNINYIGFIDSSTSIATQYVITRKSFLNETKKTIMIIDIGSHKSLATVAKVGMEKNSTKKAPIPFINVTGIGHIPYGVSNIDTCIRDILMSEFQTKHNLNVNLTAIPKVEFKFIQEAITLKHLLTGNKEARVSIEDAYQERSLHTHVERSSIDSKCADRYGAIVAVIDLALKSSKESMEDIQEVVLMGGGSLMHEIQRLISTRSGKEVLSKVLNTDDSVALGASFIAADSSRLFKVAPMIRIPSIFYAIQLEYNITHVLDDNSEKVELNTDILYNHMSRYSAKRVLNVENQTKDFVVRVSYVSLDHAPIEDHSNIPIMDIILHNITNITLAQSPYDSSHVSLHFKFNPDGLIDIYKVQMHFEKNDTSGIFSKVGQALSDFFKPSKNTTENETAESVEPSEVINSSSSSSSSASSSSPSENGMNSTKNETVKASPKHISNAVDVNYTIKILYLNPPNDSEMTNSSIKIAEILNKERERKDNAKARSDLESLLYQAEMYISDKTYENVASDEEYERLKKNVVEHKAWLEESGSSAIASEIKPKMSSVTSLITSFKERVKEIEEIPSAVNNLQSIINTTLEAIMGAIKNKDLYEISNITIAEELLEYVNQTQNWLNEKTEEQKLLKPYEKAALSTWLVNYKAKTLQDKSLDMLTQLQASMKKPLKQPSLDEKQKKTPAKNKTKGSNQPYRKPSGSNQPFIADEHAQISQEELSRYIEENEAFIKKHKKDALNHRERPDMPPTSPPPQAPPTPPPTGDNQPEKDASQDESRRNEL